MQFFLWYVISVMINRSIKRPHLDVIKLWQFFVQILVRISSYFLFFEEISFSSYTLRTFIVTLQSQQ
jgi:hypothetical protein